MRYVLVEVATTRVFHDQIDRCRSVRHSVELTDVRVFCSVENGDLGFDAAKCAFFDSGLLNYLDCTLEHKSGCSNESKYLQV